MRRKIVILGTSSILALLAAPAFAQTASAMLAGGG
jgi:hypothetical protein